MSSLTRAEAAERGATLRVSAYRVDLDLTTGGETFRSTTTITFDVPDDAPAADGAPDAATFLDVRPVDLVSVTLNGADLPLDGAVDVVDGRAVPRDGRLPLRGLTRGSTANELVVVADMAYSRECEGLHRYVDPADGRVYLYGFVYIDNAPRIFACFDQPDLKAPFTVTLATPDGWQVLGNSPAAEVEPGRWELAETAPLATYLWTVVAGPYVSFTRRHDGVPLGLHCRASLAEALENDLDEVFEVTAQCLDEYHRLFGVRYPFDRFDQVFVPEFSVLSLDHPGCVLIRELYLFRSAAPRSEHETRAVVIAHGLSLMWLAGLVTNRWWDDLWLGQAFADYMAHRVTSDVTRFDGPLTTFAVRRKAQAYVADQRPSTHPVRIDGPDVQTVLLELDRISYFKGSSALRQLAATIGTPALRAGLTEYFTRHAYGVATTEDFLDALAAGAGVDLRDWAHAWFGTSDVTTLEADITTADGVITAAVVRQHTPPAAPGARPGTEPAPRPHTLDIGLYPASGEPDVVRVRIDGEATELPQLVGRPAPAFTLLNDGDLTYAKTRFDERSAAALPAMLPRLTPVNRAMVWCSLLMSVQDGAYPAAAHLDLVARMLAVEPELSIVTEVLEQARADVADRFLDPELRPAAMAAVADALRLRLAVVEPGDELALCLARGLIEFTADADELRGWLDGGPLPAGVALDADLAWRARYRLAALGALTEDEIAAAVAADPSTIAEQFAAKCRAARPDPAAKDAAWHAIVADESLSSYGLWALAEGFWQADHPEVTREHVARFFAEMPAAARLRGDLVLDVLIRFLYPRHAASRETLRLADELLARGAGSTDGSGRGPGGGSGAGAGLADGVPAPLLRRVADFTDDLRRATHARETWTPAASAAHAAAAAGSGADSGSAASSTVAPAASR